MRFGCTKAWPCGAAILAALLVLPAASTWATAGGHAGDPTNLVLIAGIPHVRQKPDFCGEACAEMFLRKLGKSWTQDDVFNLSGVDPALGRGCVTRELAGVLRRIGFNVGDVWRAASATNSVHDLDALWAALVVDLRKGVPSIVCMRSTEGPRGSEHFRLVIGYDPASDEVIYHEPATDNAANQRMKRSRFINLWPLKYEPARSTVIRMRLDPGKLSDPVRVEGFCAADYAQHVMQVRTRLAGRDFTAVVAPPFVVIGDEPPATVRRRADQTVAWAVKTLKRDYFTRDPDAILDVWLFRDKESYEKNCRDLFNEKPTTPFGFYSDEHGALIMNIATGGGTLVHEIVHPFMRANFPKCPSWFNEGLGSLYEQSREDRGHIKGSTNWRLEGLQNAIRRDALPSFRELTGTTTDAFYRADRGTNYAQARYLCYYLQEKDLLTTFYRNFLANHEADPTGYHTLVKTRRPDLVERHGHLPQRLGASIQTEPRRCDRGRAAVGAVVKTAVYRVPSANVRTRFSV